MTSRSPWVPRAAEIIWNVLWGPTPSAPPGSALVAAVSCVALTHSGFMHLRGPGKPPEFISRARLSPLE